METQTNSSFLGSEEAPLIAPTSDEKTLAILSHVLTIVGSFVPPLVIYIIKKDQSKFVTAHALESLNFQLTLIICYIICFVLIFVLIGILLLWALSILALVLIIVATIRAGEGKLYRYPFNFRIIK